jgi:class 3 adenylate cyclase
VGITNVKIINTFPLPKVFYNLNWLDNRFHHFDLAQMNQILINIVSHFWVNPLIFLQIIFWAIIGYLLNLFYVKNNWRYDLIGTIIGLVLLFSLNLGCFTVYSSDTVFDVFNFAVIVVPAVAALICAWEFIKFTAQQKKTKPPQAELNNETSMEKIERYKQPELFAHKKTKHLNVEGMSLEDVIKMQQILRDYMKKKFVHEVTAVNIDIVESTNIKHGEPHENIIFTFSEYWKLVDQIVSRKHGKLLNRAGDGAIYIFNEADSSVLTSEDIIMGLDKFNKTTSTLKTPFRVRIGIHTGEVVGDISQGSNDVFSRTLDISAHLQKAAQPMQILISESTYKKLKFKFNFEFSHYEENDRINIYKPKDLKKSDPATKRII